jgi:hypothetical protein
MDRFFCGDAEASQAFYERNKPIIEAVTMGHDFCLKLLAQAQAKLEPQEKTVIWLLAASCLKEFEEIILLCGNGFGTGATKLVRSFYERVVTLSYLAKHTEHVQAFIDYSDIHWYKLLAEAEEIQAEFKVPEEERTRMLENYEKSKRRFKEAKCPVCKRTPPTSWIKIDTKTMASEVSEHIRMLCANAYLIPTFHMHTSFWGIGNQSERTVSGKFQFLGGRVQEGAAQEAFEHAYILLTQVMDVLNGFFELDEQEQIAQFGQAWVKACESAWGRKAKSETSPELPLQEP